MNWIHLPYYKIQCGFCEYGKETSGYFTTLGTRWVRSTSKSEFSNLFLEDLLVRVRVPVRSSTVLVQIMLTLMNYFSPADRRTP
jgi:hypothetical protein